QLNGSYCFGVSSLYQLFGSTLSSITTPSLAESPRWILHIRIESSYNLKELHNPPPLTQDDGPYNDEAIFLTICLLRRLSKTVEHPRWTRFSIRTPYFKKN
ncbi:MAG: hypothetical protein WBL44_13755, partial [Nitrososphaeraceae archaeon]